jgi:glutaredoxin
MQVTLYSRPGCHLCDVARQILLIQRADTPFDLVEIDIETDDRLELDYGIRIPVVEIDGVEAFEVEVDPRELARLVAG